MNESEATRKLCLELKRFNAVVYVISGGSTGGGIVYQRPGMPDRFLAHNWVPGGCWLEFKIGSGGCSGAQKTVLREMRERSINVFVCRHGRSIEDEKGTVLRPWDGTARDLLEGLRQLCLKLSTQESDLTEKSTS